MPSKRTILVAVVFWVLTTVYVGYRDVWPRLFASGPPPVAIDLVDEAGQVHFTRWLIFRGNHQKIGSLTTYMNHVDADDSFWFANEYRELTLDVSGVKVSFPELNTGLRITRGGDLLEQAMDGKMRVTVSLFKITDLEVKATIRGRVVDGQLVGECDIESSLGPYHAKLDPVPVPKGQPLNPLQPVNRLQNLQPGQGWRVSLVSPLEDAVEAMFRKLTAEKAGIHLSEQKREPLFAQVLPDAQILSWNGRLVKCWVIEYKQTELVARTYVRVSDGRVLAQETFRKGEMLTIERAEL